MIVVFLSRVAIPAALSPSLPFVDAARFIYTAEVE